MNQIQTTSFKILSIAKFLFVFIASSLLFAACGVSSEDEIDSEEVVKNDVQELVEAEVEPRVQNDEKTLDLSYKDMMSQLTEHGFVMAEVQPLADGQKRYLGSISDDKAVLEIIGNKEAITQTSLRVLFDASDMGTYFRNKAIAMRFVRNAVPELLDTGIPLDSNVSELDESDLVTEGDLWVEDVIAANLSEGEVETSYGGKQLRAVYEGKWIIFTVSPE